MPALLQQQRGLIIYRQTTGALIFRPAARLPDRRAGREVLQVSEENCLYFLLGVQNITSEIQRISLSEALKSPSGYLVLSAVAKDSPVLDVPMHNPQPVSFAADQANRLSYT